MAGTSEANIVLRGERAYPGPGRRWVPRAAVWLALLLFVPVGMAQRAPDLEPVRFTAVLSRRPSASDRAAAAKALAVRAAADAAAAQKAADQAAAEAADAQEDAERAATDAADLQKAADEAAADPEATEAEVEAAQDIADQAAAKAAAAKEIAAEAAAKAEAAQDAADRAAAKAAFLERAADLAAAEAAAVEESSDSGSDGSSDSGSDGEESSAEVPSDGGSGGGGSGDGTDGGDGSPSGPAAVPSSVAARAPQPQKGQGGISSVLSFSLFDRLFGGGDDVPAPSVADGDPAVLVPVAVSEQPAPDKSWGAMGAIVFWLAQVLVIALISQRFVTRRGLPQSAGAWVARIRRPTLPGPTAAVRRWVPQQPARGRHRAP